LEQKLIIKVIVAEDEELIRNNMVKKIESIDPDFQVVFAAEDGRAALDYIENNQVDILVTDIRMPAMDGIELIKTLYSHFPHIRKVIASGHTDFEYARSSIRYNVTEYLLKPIKINELKEILLKIKTSIENERLQYKENMKGMQDQAANPEEIVNMVQNFMRENFKKDLSLEKIARNFSFNPSYLSKIFIKHSGELPSKYLMSLRINEAKYLMTQHPNLSIKEVGESVGYADQFYFSRIFKQVTGVTPKDFQK